MPITDARKQRTELRLKLYANGYTPLPNKNKMALLPGWNTVDVDEDKIRGWERSPPRGEEGPPLGSYKDTGIRCGEIVAFDFDIDDTEILNDLLDVLVGEDILPETPLIRIGRPPRELWVFRMEGPRQAKRVTGGYGWPKELAAARKRIEAGNEPGKFAKLQVEVLGTGNQFGAFGQHSDQHAYAWPEGSPLDIDVSDLPAVTRETIEAVVSRATAFFEAIGLEEIDIGGGTFDGHYTRMYDLTGDMVFPTKELGAATVDDLEQYFEANPAKMLRCTVEALRPTTGGSMAGMANLVQGQICISDHGNNTTHFRASADPAPKLARISEKLFEKLGVSSAPPPKPAERRQAAPMTDLTMDPRDDFDDNLQLALERYAYVVNDNQIIDTYTNTPPMTVEHFRYRMMPFLKVEATKQGGEKIIRISEAWMQSPDRVEVATAQMRPDKPWPLYMDDGIQHANTYRPRAHDLEGGDARPGMEFLRNLVPNAEEQKYFLQWLSYKIQHPATRGPAIVMVAAARFGTGRGSFGSLLEDIFSEAYVNSVDFSTLTGKTYQAQYNEWLVGSLVVVVNEAADSDRGANSKWDAKNMAYEHLKNIVDPANTRQQIVRKRLSNFQARTFASVFIMTNHADALVIPDGDRRFYIIENGFNQAPDYWDKFHAWRLNPANVAALVHALEQIDLTGYNPYQAPPMTKAKAEMIHSSSSELDRAMAYVLAQMPGKLVVREQAFLAVDRYVSDNAVILPDEWRTRSGTTVFNRLTKPCYGAIDKFRLEDNKQHSPRWIGEPEPELSKSGEAMLEEIRKNGPTLRSIGGNVVPIRSKLLGQDDNGKTA